MTNSPAWQAADDATDDIFRVRDYAALLADALDNSPTDDPVHQGLVRLAYDLLQLGEKIREHHEKIMDAAGTPATVTPLVQPTGPRRRRA